MMREEARATAEAALSLGVAQGYLYYVAFAKVVKGWVLVEEGLTQEGMCLTEEGIAMAASIGAKLDHSYFLALSAEATAKAGQFPKALDLISEALSNVRTSLTFFYEADLYRLGASFKMKVDRRRKIKSAEADLQQAIDVAHRQGAKSLELRAAMDLCQLWREEGDGRRGLQLVRSLYASFEEGFETADLKRARALVGERASTPKQQRGRS